MGKQIKFKQSRNWWQRENLNWFIENAEFAFTNSLYKGNRVRIVTKKPLYSFGENNHIHMNCFEFDNDRYGIMITSESQYSEDFWGDVTVEKSNDVVPFLINFLEVWGAGEFVNPKRSIKDLFNRKDKIITITKN
jgi:hypothetical protein